MPSDKLPDEDYPQYVLDWLAPLSRPKQSLNYLGYFSEWLGMSIEEIYEKRKEDSKSDDLKTQRFFEEQMKLYVKYLREEKNLKLNTQKAYTTSIMSFFSSFYLPMKFRRGEVKYENPVDMQAQKLKPIPTLDEMRAVFAMGNPRDKPLILLMAQNGLAPQDVANLRIEGLELYDTDGNVKKESIVGIKNRQKTGVRQYIIVSDETLYWLEPFLRERGYPSKGWLIETQKGNRYSPRSIRDRLRELFDKALGPAGERYTAKSLRDFTHNALRMAEIDPDIIKNILGWKIGGAVDKYHLSEQVILQAWNKAKPYLTFNGRNRDSEEINRIKTQLGEMVLAWNTEKSQLETQIKQLTERVAISEDFLKRIQANFIESYQPTDLELEIHKSGVKPTVSVMTEDSVQLLDSQGNIRSYQSENSGYDNAVFSWKAEDGTHQVRFKSGLDVNKVRDILSSTPPELVVEKYPELFEEEKRE